MTREEKREQIMTAAEKLFASRRFHEITLDEIAAAARVGKGTIYLYFQDKEDLFFQVATSGFEEMCDVLQRKVPEAAPFREQLVSACVEISRFFEKRRPLFRMMHAEDIRMSLCHGALRERWMVKRGKLLAAVAKILERGVRENEIRDDVPAFVLASFLLGMLRTRAHDLEDAPERMRRHEFVVTVFLEGAGRRRRADKTSEAQIRRR